MAYYPPGSPYGQEPQQQPTPRRRRSAQQPPQYEPPQYQPQQYQPQQYQQPYQQQPYQQPVYLQPVYQQPAPTVKKKRSKLKIFLIVCAVLFVLGTILNAMTPAFTILRDTSHFARDGKLGNVYSVGVDPNVSNFQLQLVFNEVIRGDGAPIHAVFFWSSEQAMNEAPGYDVAFMTDETGAIQLTRK